MSSETRKLEYEQMLYVAEQAGLKLAIKGRIATVVFVSTLMAVTRDAERAPDFILGGLLFVALGLLHFRVIGSSFDRPWVKYVFVTIDVLLLTAAVAFLPPALEEFLGVFLGVDFVATGARLQEATTYFVVSILIAIVMRRARGVVRRQLADTLEIP